MPGTLKRGSGIFRQQVRSTEPRGGSFEHVTWSTRTGFRWSAAALEILASLQGQGRWVSHHSHPEQIDWIPDSVQTNYVIFTFVECCYHSYTSNIFSYISWLALFITYHGYIVALPHTSPDDRTLFMYSRKDSSLISLSVKMKVMPLPCWPAILYKFFRSSIKFEVLYELEKKTGMLTVFFSPLH